MTSNALHPGVVYTNIWFGHNSLWFSIVVYMFSFLCKGPLEGAQTSIFCAVDETLSTTTGKYFGYVPTKSVALLA